MTAAVGRQSLLRRILRNPETYFTLCLQRFLSQETMHSVERIFSLMNTKWTAERSDKDRWAPNFMVILEWRAANSTAMCCLSDSKPLNAAASGQKYYRRMSFDPEASTSGQTDWMRVIRPTEGWTCSRKSRVCPSLVSLDLFYVCPEVQFVL